MFLCLGIVGFAGDAVRVSGKLTQLRGDRALIADARYGMLDAANWAEQLRSVIAARVDAFEITPENRPALKAHLERLIERLIAELGAKAIPQTSSGNAMLDALVGELRRGAQALMFDTNVLGAQVPRLADAALKELTSPGTKSYLKQMLQDALSQAATSTFTHVDRTRLEQTLQRHGCKEVSSCVEHLGSRIAQEESRVRMRMIVAVVAAALVGVLLSIVPLGGLSVVGASLGCVGLLAGGLAIPMIQMEARIGVFSIQILGEPLRFVDQVLYYQSKSILDVFSVLVQSGKPELVTVALLVGLFSVIFPTAKLAATVWMTLRPARFVESSFVGFFALRSGKWSMADVMVVAMLMAFVGFRGIADSQLSGMERSTDNLEILTSNGTSLEAGFFFFTAYCFLAMWVSHRLSVFRASSSAT
jgi:hypothetical protein